MRFMMIVKANKDSEAGCMPSDELISDMTKYNEELLKAGALIDLSGLKPSSQGARVIFSEGKVTVSDGPFAETKELIAGYWLIKADSFDEALGWAKRVPFVGGPAGDEAVVEVRQLFDLEDFAPTEAIAQARELGDQLAKQR